MSSEIRNFLKLHMGYEMNRRKNRQFLFDRLEERSLLSTITTPGGSTITTVNTGPPPTAPVEITDSPTINQGWQAPVGYIDLPDQYTHIKTVMDAGDGSPPQVTDAHAIYAISTGYYLGPILHAPIYGMGGSGTTETVTVDAERKDGGTEHKVWSHTWGPALPNQYNPPDVINPDRSRPARLMYSLNNQNIAGGNDLVFLPTAGGDQWGNYVNMVGHQFYLAVRPGVDSNGLTRTVRNVQWTIPDAIKTSSWDPTTGFFEQFLPENYTSTAPYGEIDPYWAHGNPSNLTDAPASDLGSWGYQTIHAHITYFDGTTEDLDSHAPVGVPQATYTATYSTTSFGPQTAFSGLPSIMTGVVPSVVGADMVTQGYVGTLKVDPASTWRFGGNAGLLQTVNPDITRIWRDTDGVNHRDRIMMSRDLATGEIGFHPPYLDTRSSDTSVLYDFTPVGTPFVRRDSPYVTVDPDMLEEYVDNKFYETAMYRPGSPDDPYSIPVPLFKTGWEFEGEVYNYTPGGFGSNYTLIWKVDPHQTMDPISTADYPKWNANAASVGVQVSHNWLAETWWGSWDGTPGPHSPDWLGVPNDLALSVMVSTPTSKSDYRNMDLTPMLSDSSVKSHVDFSAKNHVDFSVKNHVDFSFDLIPVRKRDRLVFDFLNHNRRTSIA